MPNPIVHFEIMSKTRGQELQRFYSQLFGWTINADNPYQYGLTQTGTGRGIEGGIGPTDGVSRVSLFVEVEDLQAYLDQAVKLGATEVMPVTHVPGMVTYAMFADPDGNITGLIKSEPGGAGQSAAEPGEPA